MKTRDIMEAVLSTVEEEMVDVIDLLDRDNEDEIYGRLVKLGANVSNGVEDIRSALVLSLIALTMEIKGRRYDL